MTISRRTGFMLWLLIVSFAGTATAMTVYMNDESEIEAQSAWKEGGKVYVRVNPELCLDFPSSEVNVQKSGIPDGQRLWVAKTDRETTKSPLVRSGRIIDELVVAAGHRRDFNEIFGRSGRGEIEQMFADTFSPEQAEQTFKRCLERRLNNRDLAVVLAWYKSPVGRKVVEADSVWDFHLEENAYNYSKVETAPGFRERMSLTGQIVKITGASEMATRLTQNLLKKMMRAIPPDYPNGQEIKRRIQEEIPSFETSRKINVQVMAYTYRDLSTRELRNYLNFLRSAPGNRYMSAVRVASEEIFRKVSMNIEKDFRRYVRS